MLSGHVPGFGPGCGCHVLDLPVGHRRHTGEHVAQIGLRVDATAAACFDDGEQHRTALACFGLADEQPVLLADGGGTDGSLHGVVVDLDPAIFEIYREHGPQRQRVVDGAAHRAFGQMPTATLHAGDGPVHALHDHAALTGSFGLTLLRARRGQSHLPFDAVKMLDLQQHPPGVLRCAFAGLMELARACAQHAAKVMGPSLRLAKDG